MPNLVSGVVSGMTMAMNITENSRFSGLYCRCISQAKPRDFVFYRSTLKIGDLYKRLQSTNANASLGSNPLRGNLFDARTMTKGKRVAVMSPEKSSLSSTQGLLDSYDDEYGGVIVDPECLPSSAIAFASVLRTSLSNWKLKGKKGIWLKILHELADLVPIAIKEGFNYHHAESGYIMLTYWIPDGPCLLPDSPSHHIGAGGFVINENREVLVVKEKSCPCQCSGVWKIPTGYINKYEEIFSGVVREVREETGINTEFLEVVTFRHAHRMAFENSDLFFVCLLKPLTFDITVDEKEIQAAKWMPLDEFLGQPFYEEDHMSKKAIEICLATHEKRYNGYTAHQLTSKFDGKLSYLYYNEIKQQL